MNEANMGDPININHINTMWVWIPRYKYKIPAGIGPREIEVEFESKNSKSSGDAVNSYLTHPAFTFGGKELSGIWIGKFEISGTATGDDITSLTILPDKAPLYGKAIRIMFEALKNIMQADPNDIYGFGGHMDIHIIKNSEWGAVAYLYHSKYGKYGNSLYSGANKEIYKNPKNNATGNSSGTPAGVSGTTCAYNVIADRGNGTGACGAGASTTGNIYGIYDMVGGYYEYVLAAYIPDPLPTPSNIGDASGFSSTTSNSRFEYLPAEKYYDIYRSTSIATACSEGKCLGQALEEIDGWYSDTGTFVITSMPWIVRSGSYSGNDSAVGIFYYNRDNGEGIFGAYVGSIVVRPTLVVDDSL